MLVVCQVYIKILVKNYPTPPMAAILDFYTPGRLGHKINNLFSFGDKFLNTYKIQICSNMTENNP